MLLESWQAVRHAGTQLDSSMFFLHMTSVLIFIKLPCDAFHAAMLMELQHTVSRLSIFYILFACAVFSDLPSCTQLMVRAFI